MSPVASVLITPELFHFLRTLARNGKRDRFSDSKQRYHDLVRDPL